MADNDEAVGKAIFGSGETVTAEQDPPQVEQQQEEPEVVAETDKPTAKPDRVVPLPLLIEERRERQESERRWHESERRRQELEHFVAQMQQRYEEREPEIDPLDPQSVQRYLDQRIEAVRHEAMTAAEEATLDTHLNTSEAFARRQHGDEVVDSALKAALQRGLEQHFISQPDPYGALVSWFRTAQFLQSVGPDPAAWQEKQREELRREILAELNAGRGRQSRFPGTLADGTTAGSNNGTVTEEDIGRAIFARR